MQHLLEDGQPVRHQVHVLEQHPAAMPTRAANRALGDAVERVHVRCSIRYGESASCREERVSGQTSG